MARRRRSARVVFNRRTFGALRVGLADGILQVAETIVGVANPPDDPKTAEVIEKFAGAWIDGRKVGGNAPKPRREIPKQGIVAIAGYGFPGRFQETGTIHQPPRPTLVPAVDAVTPNTGPIMAPLVQRRMAGEP